jgi:hypothetical protein
MEARGGSDFTYSVTRSGSEKRLLPTMATRTPPTQPAVEAFLPMA